MSFSVVAFVDQKFDGKILRLVNSYLVSSSKGACSSLSCWPCALPRRLVLRLDEP